METGDRRKEKQPVQAERRITPFQYFFERSVGMGIGAGRSKSELSMLTYQLRRIAGTLIFFKWAFIIIIALLVVFKDVLIENLTHTITYATKMAIR